MKVSIDLDLPGLVDNPFTTSLLETTLAAHNNAALGNRNLSSEIVSAVTRGSGDFTKATSAALLSIGEAHAPIDKARYIFRFAKPEDLTALRKAGTKVPGWGNSFFKDGIDPAFIPVHELIAANCPDYIARLDTLTMAVNGGFDKKLHPNAAILTAMVCEIINLPPGLESSLFILGRLPAWAKLCSHA